MNTSQQQENNLEARSALNGVYAFPKNKMCKNTTVEQFSCKEIDLSIFYENIRV